MFAYCCAAPKWFNEMGDASMRAHTNSQAPFFCHLKLEYYCRPAAVSFVQPLSNGHFQQQRGWRLQFTPAALKCSTCCENWVTLSSEHGPRFLLNYFQHLVEPTSKYIHAVPETVCSPVHYSEVYPVKCLREPANSIQLPPFALPWSRIVPPHYCTFHLYRWEAISKPSCWC